MTTISSHHIIRKLAVALVFWMGVANAAYGHTPPPDCPANAAASLPAGDSVRWQQEGDANPVFFVAAKTNTLHLLALAFNFGAELQVARQWSVDLPIWYSPYNMFCSRRKWRLMAMQPEVRRWLDKAGEGHFVGLHTHVIGFNLALNSTQRYQDPQHAAWGFGLGYGFAKTFGRDNRWAFEANVGLGFIAYKYDKYRNEPNGEYLGSGSGTYWGVTRLAFSMAYRWPWHPKKLKKGGQP